MRDFTDSYCERCGTRYTFGPTPSKRPSLAGARVLAKGLKNFVMSDEASMDDAMAAARIDVGAGETARIAEEFHRTFNFCMSCRQYACDKCWNPIQSACLSCAPLGGYEPVARRTLDGIAPTTRPTADAGLGVAYAEAIPWPSEDPLPGRPGPHRNGKRAPESTTSVPEVAQPAPAMQPTQPAQPAEEGTLVRAQLSHPSPYEQPDPQPEAPSPSHPLDEEAARLAPHESDRRTDPETPARGAWEPVVPAPQIAPSSDFDLMDSLRKPIEAAEPTAPAGPRLGRVIGRLLTHRIPIAAPAQEPAPKVSEILKAPTSEQASAPDSTGQAGSWPRVTPWGQRSIGRRNTRPDSDAAPLEGAEAVSDEAAEAAEAVVAVSDAPVEAVSDAPVEAVSDAPVEAISDARVEAVEAASEPAASEPAASEPAATTEQVVCAEPSPAAAEPEPVLAAQAEEPVPAARAPETAPTPATPVQQPLFTMPPATVERWPAIKHRPSEPAPVPSPSAEAPAPWPPTGASWPPHNAAPAPWPEPDPALVSASVAAAHQAEQVESQLIATIWAESAQEVLNRGNVRVCHRCALPVSTHARFCRRCGTQQT